jgi:hypothetical protein
MIIVQIDIKLKIIYTMKIKINFKSSTILLLVDNTEESICETDCRESEVSHTSKHIKSKKMTYVLYTKH